jgi:hypothetical protein
LHLEGRGDWADIPKPAPGCAVCDGKTVSIIFVQVQYQLLEISAIIILKSQGDLQHSVIFKLISNTGNMLLVICRY